MTIRDVFSDYYQPSLERMYMLFCDHHLPCSFSDRLNRPCVRTRLAHGAEHRTAQDKIIGTGRYEADFSADSYQPLWIRFLKDELDEHEDDYWEALDEEPPTISRREIAARLHLNTIYDFFTDLGTAAPFISHASCFACLLEIPRHPLPCGHVICDNCVRMCGDKGHGKLQLEYCPLHRHTSFEPPWEIECKSEYAGVRILVLDGGGMRGIVELEVLRAIEKALGCDIRIQSFFDLIIGTSTGGINALALGVKQWPVSYCISSFEKFCDQAFTEREFGGIWGLEQAALVNHGSLYKTKPLHKALQETLGQGTLFGGSDTLRKFRTKVAVTTTSGDGKEAMLLANYNRPQYPTDSLIFVRPDNPEDELEVWEAAAATSAAPFYFKPFVHQKTGKSYIDGGLYHNNPVHVANRERKLLWPDLANKHPDMLLSIGTGQNLDDVEREKRQRHSSVSRSGDRSRSPTRQARGLRRTLNSFGALYQRFDNILDAENTWTDFKADIDNLDSNFPSPYIRINLDLERKLPPFDAKEKFQELRQDVRERLRDPDVVRMTRDIASSLIASSFYFRLLSSVPQRSGRVRCTGIPHIDIEVSSPMASTTIALVLAQDTQGEATQRYLLSGFPRTLVQEMPCKPSPVELGSNPTRTDYRAYSQPQQAHSEGVQTSGSASRTPPSQSRPSHVQPSLPSRPVSSHQYAAHSRDDSAIELPHHASSFAPPRPHVPQEQVAMPRQSYQAFSYERPSNENRVPAYLVERAARQIQKEDEGKLRKGHGGGDRSRPKRLVKRSDTSVG
ncbi:FabD/lysophospholipase-like protein [Aureobasidium pullulans]|uniref:FabD/lysophospholipase-like protein n=1 Tax=Aureobasidium pullulans TaxID=5580 RepID=A0A4S9L0B4_AURPU|nr:FabD/lysophospholipase-like protein [Aureobasidium pullulans]